jgi:hypothetical protein
VHSSGSISCAGHASIVHATKPKLTSNPDHSVGADHSRSTLLLFPVLRSRAVLFATTVHPNPASTAIMPYSASRCLFGRLHT